LQGILYRHKEKLYKKIIKGIGLYLYNLQHWPQVLVLYNISYFLLSEPQTSTPLKIKVRWQNPFSCWVTCTQTTKSWTFPTTEGQVVGCKSWKRIRVHSSSHFKGYPMGNISTAWWWLYHPPCFLKCNRPRPHFSHCCTYITTSNKGHTKKKKLIFAITDVKVAHSNFVQNLYN
jgi:hypothetical protein